MVGAAEREKCEKRRRRLLGCAPKKIRSCSGARADFLYRAGILRGKIERVVSLRAGPGPRARVKADTRGVARSVGFGGRGVEMAGDLGGKGSSGARVIRIGAHITGMGGGVVGMRSHVRRAAAGAGADASERKVYLMDGTELRLPEHEALLRAG